MIPLLPLVWLLRGAAQPKYRAETAQLVLRGSAFFLAYFVFEVSRGAFFALTPLWLTAIWSWPLVLVVMRFARGPRLVYYVTLATWPFELRDAWRGGAAFMAARWLLKKGDRSKADTAWIRKKLGTPTRVETCGMTAFALVTAMDGDLTTARTLLEALVVETREGCAQARKVGRRFLVLDAIRSGRFEDALQLAKGDDGATRNIASWLRGVRAEGSEPLAERVLLGERARLDVVPFGHLQESAARDRTPPERALPDDATERAVLCHGALALATTPDARTFYFAEACAAWDAAFEDGALVTRLEARAAELGVDLGDLHDLRSSITSELAAIVRRHRFDLGPTSKVSNDVRVIVAEALLADIDVWAERLEARVPYTTTGNVYDWIEYRTIRRLYDEAWRIGGQETRTMAYVRVYPALTNLVARAVNYGFDLRLARAAIAWMRMEAWGVGHARSFDLHTRNMAAANR
jgi:hypothetical protein